MYSIINVFYFLRINRSILHNEFIILACENKIHIGIPTHLYNNVYTYYILL